MRFSVSNLWTEAAPHKSSVHTNIYSLDETIDYRNSAVLFNYYYELLYGIKVSMSLYIYIYIYIYIYKTRTVILHYTVVKTLFHF